MKNRIIIFGGKGFIGSSLADFLSKKKIYHKVYGRNEVDFEKKKSISKCLKILKPKDIIVFTVAIAPCKNYDMFFKNSKIIENFIQVTRKFNLYSKIIYISSDAVFADSYKKLSEKSQKAPENLHGLMHLNREILLKETIQYNKLIILRPTLVFGKNDPHNSYGPNLFSRLIKSKKEIKLFGKGEEKRDHVFIDDLIRLAYLAIKKPNFFGELNVVSGKVITFKQIAKILNSYGNSVKIFETKRVGKIPHNGYRAFNNRKIIKNFSKFKFTDIDKALKTLV